MDTASVPPKVVTYCSVYSKGLGRAERDDDDEIALLFHDASQDVSLDDQVALMVHEDVQNFFPSWYFGLEVVTRFGDLAFVITAHYALLPVPDETPGVVLLSMQPDRQAVHAITAAEVFEQCTSMWRLMDQCTSCAHMGEHWAGCYARNVPGQATALWRAPAPVVQPCQLTFPFETIWPRTKEYDFGQDEVVFERWKKLRKKTWRDTFADYTVIPALATHTDVGLPGATSCRVPEDHDFGNLKYAKDTLSERSQTVGMIRKRKREWCSKCEFGCTYKLYVNRSQTTEPCCKWRMRKCTHGPWTSEEVVQYTLARMQTTLEETRFDFETLWRVAHVAGTEFQYRDKHTGRKRGVIVNRLCECYDAGFKLAIRVSRAALKYREEYFSFTNPNKLYAFLPDFLKKEWDDVPNEFDPKIFALWCHACSLQRGYERRGWGGSYKTLQYVEARHGYVEVGVADGRTTWTHSFHDFREILTYANNHLPLFEVTNKVLEGEEVLPFTFR